MGIAATIHIRTSMDSPEDLLTPQIEAVSVLADALSEYDYSYFSGSDSQELARTRLMSACMDVVASIHELTSVHIYDVEQFRVTRSSALDTPKARCTG